MQRLPLSLRRGSTLSFNISVRNKTSSLNFYCKIGKKGEKERKAPISISFDTYLYLTITIKEKKKKNWLNNK